MNQANVEGRELAYYNREIGAPVLSQCRRSYRSFSRTYTAAPACIACFVYIASPAIGSIVEIICL